MRPIDCVVETGIYADDLDQAELFYRDVLGLKLRGKEAGRHVFFRVGDRSMLLVFRPEATLEGDHLPGHGAGARVISRWASPPRISMHGGSSCCASRRDRT